jgi:predicted dehydrogenase
MTSTSTAAVGVGFIGAGNISTQYLDNLTKFADVDVRFIADIDLARAEEQATKYGIAGSGTVDELLARDDIEIVINLTIPAVHAEVGRQVIAAGKHVWSEKPLALESEDGRSLLAAAEAAGLRVACAPDTVLGSGIQSALRTIARGDIGEPLTATTMFQVPGPESWHPRPEFLYARGGGPLFDMGAYYITTLVHAFGSASRVQAVSSKSHETRTIGSGPAAGTVFPVEVPTHHAALISFAGGQSSQTTFSFQQALPRQGFVEITGTEGTLVLPDPNQFVGDSTLWRFGSSEPTTIRAEGSEWGRGTGVVDLARSIRAGVPEKASGALASHVLDVMIGIRDAAESGDAVAITSTVVRPEPLPVSFDPAAATL